MTPAAMRNASSELGSRFQFAPGWLGLCGEGSFETLLGGSHLAAPS
jgi:hypothetical protein